MGLYYIAPHSERGRLVRVMRGCRIGVARKENGARFDCYPPLVVTGRVFLRH